MATKVNTRIILKNDALSAWQDSSLSLRQGEVALAKAENGKYEVRIGQGGTYKNAAQLQISASQVVGLENNLNALSTSFSKVGALTDLTGTYTNGSIAVVTADIDGEHTEYTAYYYDSTVTGDVKWRAMDGNYNAENVYFSKDFTYTTQIGELSGLTNGSGTLAAKGKNVKQVFDAILAKEANPTTTYPSYTFSVSGSQGIKEVGDTYTVPAATFTYTNDGEYTYGPEPTGVKVESGKVTVARTTTGETASKTNDAELAINGTVVVPAGSTGVTYLDYESKVTYNYTCTAEHTAGDTPVTNLGNDYDSGAISAGKTWSSSPTTASATFYGYRNLWLGSVTDADTTIDETFVKANLEAIKSSANLKYEIGAGSTSKTSGYIHKTLKDGAKRIIVVLPASGNYKRTLSQVLLQSASNTPVTTSYKNIGQIDIGGKVAGANTMKYNVYVYQPDAIGADEVHDISIG